MLLYGNYMRGVELKWKRLLFWCTLSCFDLVVFEVMVGVCCKHYSMMVVISLDVGSELSITSITFSISNTIVNNGVVVVTSNATSWKSSSQTRVSHVFSQPFINIILLLSPLSMFDITNDKIWASSCSFWIHMKICTCVNMWIDDVCGPTIESHLECMFQKVL